MNYEPFCGYWFTGAESASEYASFFCSFGLLSTAPVRVYTVGKLLKIIGASFKKIIG